MSYTRDIWSRALLTAIGNSAPNQSIVDFVIGWTCAESTTNSRALYNLLNTTQQEPGSVPINSVGVQSFVSFQQGIEANAAVLQNGLYPDLLSALKNNYTNWLFPQPTNAIHGDLSMWVTGTRTANIDSYIINIIDENFSVRASELFQGDITMGLPPTAHDDGTSIHFDGSPFVITLGFRTLYLQMASQGMIPPDDFPLGNEYGVSPVELNNPSYWVSPGTAQETRYFRFGWSPDRGVHRTYLGQEYQFIKHLLTQLQEANSLSVAQGVIEQLERIIEQYEHGAHLPEVDEVVSISQPTGTQEVTPNTSGTVSSWSPEPTTIPTADTSTTINKPIIN